MIAFLEVLFRGFSLVAQGIAIGGVAFLLLLGRHPRAPRVLSLVALGAVIVALAQVITIVAEIVALGGTGTLAAMAATSYFLASFARVAVCVALAAVALLARRRPGVPALLALVVTTVALAITAAWTSHAAGRLESRGLLLTLETVHQLAAATWIGGLLHLLATPLWRGETRDRAILGRFSLAMLGTVAVLVAAGAALAVFYIGSTPALVGTSYGLMMSTKVVILAALMLLGGMNFLALKGGTPGTGLTRLPRFVEVEFGLGVTVMLVAASLTSLPVAADIGKDRATVAEIWARMAPRWPAFTTPALADMPVDDRDAPRTDADREWSEYNHHVAGLFVLAMGVLAILYGTGHARWARHWPLVFLGLAAFLFVRDDPGAWPIGPQGFWESMQYPEVLQHRTFVLLVIAFGIFEWMVRSGRLRATAFALVFPLLCAFGGALLFTHSHGTTNLKEEFLTEMTHTPLALLGMAVGWGRWLELRLPACDRAIPARVWEWSLALVGVVLLLYRES